MKKAEGSNLDIYEERENSTLAAPPFRSVFPEQKFGGHNILRVEISLSSEREMKCYHSKQEEMRARSVPTCNIIGQV